MKKTKIVQVLKVRLYGIAVFCMVLLSATTFTGCEDDMPAKVPPVVPVDTLIIGGSGNTTPYIDGTFIDFWNKENWTDNQWTAHMNEMKEIGITTLFIQFTAYNHHIWTDSDNTYSTSVYKNALYNLLNAANKADVNVFVGLYFNENYWDNASNATEMSLHAQRAMDLADDIWLQSKNLKSFAGWYISQEGAPYYYNTEAKFKVLKNNLINPIANHCKALGDKPVTTTVFFNHNIASTTKFRTFMKRMSTCNLDVIMVQDGIGVDHCNLEDLDKYYKAANDGLFVDGNFNGAFWADVETFTPQGKPESFVVVKEKLETISKYVRKIVTFQYYSDMSPSGPNGSLAKKLRDDYKAYAP